jgi:phosphate starvation-inducible protein PhoH
MDRKPSRKQKRLNNQNDPNANKLNFNLLPIQPLTENQKLVFRNYQQGKNLMLHGLAGTGKSFLAIYLSLNEIINTSESVYKKLLIVRSAVATRELGHMPGKLKDKAGVYEAPYYTICNKMYNRGDAYDYLKQKGLIEFTTTSFIRGLTWENCIVIVDEMENLNLHELDSVITRVGMNCKIIFCGDFSQTDFTKEHEKKGLPTFMTIIERMKSFGIVEFDSENDIVRSGLAREYIIQKRRLGIVT